MQIVLIAPVLDLYENLMTGILRILLLPFKLCGKNSVKPMTLKVTGGLGILRVLGLDCVIFLSEKGIINKINSTGRLLDFLIRFSMNTEMRNPGRH